jgi:predicted TPR repeat methyltransferase
MSALYNELAKVYDQMYQQLFDYDREFAFYHQQLQNSAAQSVLELGCGTGNLAQRFCDTGYDYWGIDLSESMVTLARQRVPKATIHAANMCSFELGRTFDMICITGRSISYLVHNQAIEQCFSSVLRHLSPQGKFIFDAIDAAPLFSDFHQTRTDEIMVSPYRRLSRSTPNLTTGWTWDWASDYYENEIFIGRDEVTLRAFLGEELRLLMVRNGLTLSQILEKEAYAWKDAYFIAHK